jgi:hypothetical protein
LRRESEEGNEEGEGQKHYGEGEQRGSAEDLVAFGNEKGEVLMVQVKEERGKREEVRREERKKEDKVKKGLGEKSSGKEQGHPCLQRK